MAQASDSVKHGENVRDPSSSLVRVSRNSILPIDQVLCRTARTRDDLVGSFEILQRRYVDAGLSNSSDLPLRVMPHQLSHSSQIFVARQWNQVIGTVTLACDGPGGLPADESYADSITNARRQSRRIGEITSLAVDPESDSNLRVFAELTRLLKYFARAQGIDYLVAIVHPRHAEFYKRAMGCELIGSEQCYEPVGGLPGVVVGGSVVDAGRYRQRWRNHYFDAHYTSDELQWQPISVLDRQYFKMQFDPICRSAA